jgi:hypothetical protein
MANLSGLRLPFQFDPGRLQADLASVAADAWAPHYNERDYGGEWRGISLRSSTGAAADLAAVPSMDGGAGIFRDTPVLDRCPYFRDVLAAFQCPLKAVRLLGLAPGSFIREHSDNALDYDDGEIRIHIPIQTNPQVEFYVSGERLLLAEGGCYYVNVNLPHRVANRGTAERIHLVIDAKVNEWVHAIFRQCVAEGRIILRSPLPPRSFEEFRTLVFQTPALRERLRTISERRLFIAAAVELGRERGYEFNEGDVDAGLRNHQTFTEDPAQGPSGLTPVKVYLREGRPFAEWIDVGGRSFAEPFFRDSVRAALRAPFTLFSRREMPLDAVRSAAPIAPAGIIFHTSRCGSTLVARMLGTLPGALVRSEPTPVDDVIQAKLQLPGLAEEEHVRWLQWVVTALGEVQYAGNSRYFLKLDSWHVHDLPLVRAAFPETPWVFLQRDASEVVASQVRGPGMQGAPGAMDPRILRLTFDDVVKLDRQHWCERVIGDYLEAARAFRSDPMGLFVDYTELPDAVWNRVCPHFGISLSEEDAQRMRDIAQYDAKNPRLFFDSSKDPAA